MRVAYGGESKHLEAEKAAIARIDEAGADRGRALRSFDLDVLDDSYGRANEFAAPFGLTLEQLERIVAAGSSHVHIRAIAFTAHDPNLAEGARFAATAVRAIERVLYVSLASS